MADRKLYRILSLDGGGIRGLISAIWLARLEQRLGAPLYQFFDLVAGTSTGAILGCGISAGIPAERIVDLYQKRGREVFPGRASRLWNRATRAFSQGLSLPKYDDAGLGAVLKDVFEERIFGKLQITPTLVFAYDTLTRDPVVFKNNRPQFYPLAVWEVCKASSSAPTYFPAHVMNLSGADVPLIDGGVVANNPAACAIAEAVRFNAGQDSGEACRIEDFVVASFGTGQAIRRITAEEAREWGPLEWAIPMIDVLFDGSADSVHYIASQLIKPEQYFRFQTPLEDAYDDMDNADTTNLNALTRIATAYVDSGDGRDRLEALAKMLTPDH